MLYINLRTKSGAKKLPLAFLILLLVVAACRPSPTANSSQNTNEGSQKILKPTLQEIIDSVQMRGAILVYDLNQDTYYSNNFAWADKAYLPASTYKIPHSLIALESGVIESDSSVFRWDGEPRRLRVWERDLTLKEAFHFSCVPCYQEIARSVGSVQMNRYLDKLQYGNMRVDSSNVDLFWLEGESAITQYQQIDFLKRFYQNELPITPRTKEIMTRMIVIEENDQYRLSGKTGWSIRNNNNNAWYVGYVEAGEEVYFFATNVEPNLQFDMDLFPVLRKKITYRALQELGMIKS